MRYGIAFALLAVSLYGSAAPAPWHKWRSKLNGAEACAQSSPGDGWQKAGGPYKDARCSIPGVPGQA